MSRDPFDQMKSRNPVPEGQGPTAPMGVAGRIVAGRARRAGWPGWAVAAATAAVVLGVGGGMYWLLGTGGEGDVAGIETTTTTTAVAATTAPTPTTQAPPTSATTVVTADVDVPASVYFMADIASEGRPDGPFLIPAARVLDTADTVAGVLELLLEGPHPDETAASPELSTAIPAGTRLLGSRTDASGIATANLSAEFVSGGGSFSMMARVAQVIATLTALDGVDGVRFEIEGVPTTVFGGEGLIVPDPATAADVEGSLPAVMIDTPAWGADGGNPLIAMGTANVFEATVSIELVDGSGALLYQGFTNATCGTGCRGSWEIEIPYEVSEPQFGTLRAYESSAEDGRPINVREHRVWLHGADDGTTPIADVPCSASRVAAGGLVDQSGLPVAVGAKRAAIWAAAMGCDWAGLQSLLGTEFSYSFGSNTDAIGYWQGLEAAGDDPLYFLAELLNRPFGTIVAGDFTYYVWPSAFVGEWQNVPAVDREALRPIYDDADFAGFAQFGAYIGYRVSILEDGTWVSFVAGD